MIDLIFKPLIINNDFKTTLIIGENDSLNFKLIIDLYLKLNKIKNFKNTIIFNNQYQQFFENNNFKYLIFSQLDLYSKNHIIQNVNEDESLIIFEVKTYVDAKLIEELIKNTNLNFLILSKDSRVFINYSSVKSKIDHIFLFNHYDKQMLYSLYAKDIYSFPGFLTTFVSMTINDNTFVIDNLNKKIYNYKFPKNYEHEQKNIIYDNILNLTKKFKLQI